jgi:hypothetical protein
VTAPALAAVRPVRLALLLDDVVQPAWIGAVLDRVVREGTAVLAGVGLCGDLAPSADVAPSSAHAAYLRFDARRYGCPDLPTSETDLGPRFGAAARVDVPGRVTAGWWAPDPDGVTRVQALGADVVWYLGACPMVEPAPRLAAAGTWALDPAHGATGVRAILDGVPDTTTALRRLADETGPGAVLARVRTSTERISVTVNRAQHVRHLAELVAGLLGRMSRGGDPGQQTVGPAAGDSPQDASGHERPLGRAEVAHLAARVVTRLVRAKADDARTVPGWFLAYRFADEGGPDNEQPVERPDAGVPSTDARAFRELLPPPDRYWADPFPAAWDGAYYLFYEEHLASERNAHLAVARLDAERGLVDAAVVLRRPYHLSFPSVFQWNDAWYMTPETMTEGEVGLYRADRFPDAWTYVGPLVSGAGFVDPVIARLNGLWWMFVGVVPPGAQEATALHLYYAETPLGPWTPHAVNPAVVDVRAGRPAGRVFARGGAFYRPVQDGAPHYGHAMNIHRIDALTPSTFRETPVARVEPSWRPGLIGTHTLNAAGRLTVLDALRRVPRRGTRHPA